MAGLETVLPPRSTRHWMLQWLSRSQNASRNDPGPEKPVARRWPLCRTYQSSARHSASHSRALFAGNQARRAAQNREVNRHGRSTSSAVSLASSGYRRSRASSVAWPVRVSL